MSLPLVARGETLGALERYHAHAAIAEWKPDVME